MGDARVTQSFIIAAAIQDGDARVTQSYLIVGVGVGISCNNPASGNVNVFYTHTFLGGSGDPPYTFSINAGTLPPGLALDPSTGIASGIPLAAGGFSFTVGITDSMGATSSVDCSITILPDVTTGSVTITMYGWKLFRDAACQDEPEEIPEPPPIKRAV